MSYKVKVFLPTKQRSAYINELTNNDVLTIAKYIKANDDIGLSLFFDKLLSTTKANSIIDKFFIITQLRALNFSNNLTLKGRHVEGRDATYKKDIFEFLGDFLENYQKVENKFKFNFEEMEIIFQYPAKLFFKNFISLLEDIVLDIKIKNTSIFSEISKKERLKILLQLKDDVIVSFKAHLEQINNDSKLFFIENNDKDISFPNIKVSFFGNTVFNILKSIFKIEITYFYNKLYVSMSKLGITYSDFMKLTFVETDILLSIFKSANNIK